MFSHGACRGPLDRRGLLVDWQVGLGKDDVDEMGLISESSRRKRIANNVPKVAPLWGLRMITLRYMLLVVGREALNVTLLYVVVCISRAHPPAGR
jgi:hypothetical protein